MSGGGPYSARDWEALGVPPRERVVPMYRQAAGEGGEQTPTEGPIVCTPFVAELRPTLYRRDGSIPYTETIRLIGVLRQRLREGLPIYDDDRPDKRAAEGGDVMEETTPRLVEFDPAEVDARRADARAAANGEGA